MKKRNFIILFILLICVVILGIIFICLKTNRYTSNSNYGNIPVKSNGTYISSILYKADDYIKNNIDLTKTNESIEIDINKIVNKSDWYKKNEECNGKIIFNNINKSEAYSYKISTGCNFNDKFNTGIYNIELMKFKLNNDDITEGNTSQVFPVSDGYLISFTTDFYYLHLGYADGDELGRSSNNILLVKIDENGIFEWAAKFGDKLTNGKNKTSEISYEKVYEENNSYIVLGIIDINEGSSFEEKYGLDTVEIMQKYSKDGTLLSEQLLPSHNNYIKTVKGEDDLYYYFNKYNKFIGFDNKGEIKNEIEISDFDELNEALGAVDKDGSYYFYNKSLYKTIYKYDKNGNKKWEINLDDNFTNIKGMYTFNNKLVIEVGSKKENQSLPKNNIIIYNLDGSFYKFFDYNTEDKYSYFELKNIFIEDDYIVVESKDFEDNNEKTLIDVINKEFNYESRTIYNDIQFTDFFDIKQSYLNGFDTYIPYGETVIKENQLIKYFSYGDNIIFCKYNNLNK